MTMRKANGAKVSTRLWISLAVLTLLFSVGAFKKKNQLESVQVEQAGEFYQVVITANAPGQQPMINRLVDPVRIIVDYQDTKVAKTVPKSIDVNNGLINQILITQSRENNADMSRVEIGLDKMVVYELNPTESKLAIVLKPAEAAELAPSGDLYAATPGQLIVEGATAPITEVTATADIPTNGTGTATGSMMAEAGGTSAGATVGTVPPGKTGTRLLDIAVTEQKEETRIQLVEDATPGDYKSFEMKNPSRLVLDLYKVKTVYPGRVVQVSSQGIARIRIGQHPDKLRLVFDASGATLPFYNMARQEERMVITVSKSVDVTGPAAPVLAVPVLEAPPAAGPMEEPLAPSAPVVVAAPGLPAAEAMMPKVLAVDFKYTAQTSTVVIKTSEPVKYEKRENTEDLVFSIVLKNAKIPPELERSLDTTEFTSPVNLIGSFQATPEEVNVVVSMNTWAAPEVRQEGNQILVALANPGGSIVAPPTPAMPVDVKADGAPPDTFAAPTIPSAASAAAPSALARKPIRVETLTGTKIYTGAPIKIDAKNLDILDALRAIAEVSGLNIITADDVKGKITLKLDNVAWDQALDLILETKGLGMVQYGNVVRVAPIKEIQADQEETIKAIQQRQNLRPLQTRIVPLNFAKALEISNQMKTMSSDRGTVDTDKRTNSLIIKDIPERIQEMMVVIASLDAATPQVLIEARIVEASIGVSRELGINWGINYNSGPAWGNPTGLNFPNSVQVGGAVLGGQLDVINPMVLNAAGAQGGALGITMGSLTNSVSLDLLLKSMETQNKAKIVSSPRIMTMDNQKATITQGTTIPYPPSINLAQGAAGGSQWLFVEAALRLEVTPHITPDGTVILDVKASNNTPNLKVVSGGAPSIDKKEAETQVIMKDGETIVIGGIYQTKDTETTNQTPFLSRIPFLGKLFQDRYTENSRSELLIFLTPRIIR